MEAALCTHNFVFAGDFASQLECSVVGLGAAVAEIRIGQTFWQHRLQLLQQRRTLR